MSTETSKEAVSKVFGDITETQITGVIVHHWDTDGIVSAAILQNYFAEFLPSKTLDTFTPTITNYYLTDAEMDRLQEKYDFVLTCDINFPEGTVNGLAKRFPGQVYMFDHHHQTPYSQVHYYNEAHPACASYINDLLGLPNGVLPVIAIVGDKEEAVQNDPVYYPRVEEIMQQHDLSFMELLGARQLIDSSYIVDDYDGMRATVQLLRHDPLAVLTDAKLQENVDNVTATLAEISEIIPDSVSAITSFFSINSQYNILSHATRNLSRQYPDRIIFTRQFKNDQYTLYVRRRDLDYDMTNMIAFARELGLNSGGKDDVVGIIIPKDDIDQVFSKVRQKLATITSHS